MQVSNVLMVKKQFFKFPLRFLLYWPMIIKLNKLTTGYVSQAKLYFSTTNIVPYIVKNEFNDIFVYPEILAFKTFGLFTSLKKCRLK